MGKFHRLTLEDRYQIDALMQTGISLRAISKVLGRSPSTILRELARNKQKSKYEATKAHRLSCKRRATVGRRKIIAGELEEVIRAEILAKLSPEQVSAKLRLESRVMISHESIYRFIYEDGANGGSLWKELRRSQKKRVTHAESRMKESGVRDDRMWIDSRPPIIEERNRLGDFERDLMEGKRNGPVVLAIVDRTSRLTLLRWLERKNAVLVHDATIEALSLLQPKSITNDNGPEFSMHYFTAQVLQVPIYFTRPHHPWERGTNENTIGLIRQWCPSGTDPMPETIPEIQKSLNNRPRKVLGFKTPLQVHLEGSGVAMRC